MCSEASSKHIPRLIVGLHGKFLNINQESEIEHS